MHAWEIISAHMNEHAIEYYGVLDYKFVREINSALLARSGISPTAALVFLMPYYTGRTDNISLYAASPDYHLIAKNITSRLVEELGREFPENKFCPFADHSPIDERHAALSLGLGILGDNGLIINEKYGSFVFIASIFTDLTAEELPLSSPCAPKYCEHCGRCSAACPTGILRGEGADCLSAITQRRGELTDSEITLMRKYNTLWGCDICSTVCPHNSAPPLTPIRDFYIDRIEGIYPDTLDKMTDEEFKRRAFAWRGRKTVERNIKYLFDN